MCHLIMVRHKEEKGTVVNNSLFLNKPFRKVTNALSQRCLNLVPFHTQSRHHATGITLEHCSTPSMSFFKPKPCFDMALLLSLTTLSSHLGYRKGTKWKLLSNRAQVQNCPLMFPWQSPSWALGLETKPKLVISWDVLGNRNWHVTQWDLPQGLVVFFPFE